MKRLGVGLIVLGLLFLGIAGIGAPNAPNISYLVGTFLPGLFCLIVGLKLRQEKKPKKDAPSEQ
jgi:lipopolysaccharide export LptBFGC system permease protein LptF